MHSCLIYGFPESMTSALPDENKVINQGGLLLSYETVLYIRTGSAVCEVAWLLQQAWWQNQF